MVMRSLVIPTQVDPETQAVTGLILMWHGLIANIPAGWVLCDGNNGTPDLRESFVKGAAAATEAGASGGSATHTHAGHSAHAVTQPNAHAAFATHQHGVAYLGATSTTFRTADQEFGLGTDITATEGSALGVNTDTNNRSLTEAISGGTPDAHAGSAVDAHSAHDTPNSEPVNFVILYIMKT